MEDGSVPGMAAAGWFVARELLKEMVISGALPRDRAMALLDRLTFQFEQHAAGPEPGRSTNAAAREHLERLITNLPHLAWDD